VRGACYLWPGSPAYDCGLSADEIVQRENARLNPVAVIPNDGGTGETRQICEQSNQCGLALACQGGFCGACSSDADCADGEGCALQICLRLPYIGCRSNADCSGPTSHCISNGYTGGHPRANEATVTRCLAIGGGASTRFESFVWQRESASCVPGANCSQRVSVDGADGHITVKQLDLGATATGQLNDVDLHELAGFLNDYQTTWVLEAPFKCPPAPLTKRSVEIVAVGGQKIAADVTGCSGPPFDELARWGQRMIAATEKP
jgi:hypothetical protein